MKFETLTYSAVPTDYSVANASVPTILGRLESLQGSVSPERALSAAPLSAGVLQFWMWMSLQISACLAKCSPARQAVSEPSHIWQVPSANSDAPERTVRVNRSMSRKLRRLQRLHPPSYFDGPAYRSAGERSDLSETQYLELIIRRYRWSRTQVYRLNPTRRDLMWQAVRWAGLQGDALCLLKPATCLALLSPD